MKTVDRATLEEIFHVSYPTPHPKQTSFSDRSTVMTVDPKFLKYEATATTTDSATTTTTVTMTSNASTTVTVTVFEDIFLDCLISEGKPVCTTASVVTAAAEAKSSDSAASSASSVSSYDDLFYLRGVSKIMKYSTARAMPTATP